MTLKLSTRIFAAAGLLTAGLASLAIASHSGEVSLRSAGLQVTLTQAPSEHGTALVINQEQCPPHCPFLDINWKRQTKAGNSTSSKILN